MRHDDVLVALVCMYRSVYLQCVCVCNTITFDRHDAETSFYSAGLSLGDTCQVCIWWSSGQYHGHMKKTHNFLFPQYKNSVGNNSGSIEDVDGKFVWSTEFTSVMGRLVWPPYLLRDRKYTHLRVVCLRLKGSPVIVVVDKRPLEHCSKIMRYNMCWNKCTKYLFNNQHLEWPHKRYKFTDFLFCLC